MRMHFENRRFSDQTVGPLVIPFVPLISVWILKWTEVMSDDWRGRGSFRISVRIYIGRELGENQ